GDGCVNASDVDPTIFNPDTDMDGMPNDCDADDDNDGCLDVVDNNRLINGPDSDGDGIDDDCDACLGDNSTGDNDLDGTCDDLDTDDDNDNCPDIGDPDPKI